jgi:uncharacterized protein YifE (UPF0438 family)
MSDVLVVSPSGDTVTQLDTARDNLANVATKTGEVIGAYAKALCKAFNLVSTTDLKGKKSQPVKAERAKFVEVMKARGVIPDTIDQYWKRVKEASGRVKTTNRVSGGTSVDDANIRDLKTILNRIDNAESENAPLSFKVVNLFLEIADQMGVDTSKYGLTSDTE